MSGGIDKRLPRDIESFPAIKQRMALDALLHQEAPFYLGHSAARR